MSYNSRLTITSRDVVKFSSKDNIKRCNIVLFLLLETHCPSLRFLPHLTHNQVCYPHQSVTYRYQEFLIFLVVYEPVSEKIGTVKKSRNQYRKNLVPERSLRTRSEKFGTGADSCRQNLEFRRFIMGTGTV